MRKSPPSLSVFGASAGTPALVLALVLILATPGLAQAQHPVTTQTRLVIGAGLRQLLTAPVRFFERLFARGDHPSYEVLEQDPEFFALLQIKRKQLTYAEENTLSFINTNQDFEGVVPKKFGFCGGMTEVLRDVSYMAFFDQENRSGQLIPDRMLDPAGYTDFYLRKFEEMSKAVPQIVPGFANLHELSSDPLLEPALKLLVARRWADEAVKPSGTAILRRARKAMDPDELQETLERIETRVTRGELPKLMFSAFAPRPVGGKRIHVVSIWKVDRSESGSLRLYAWETNFHVRDVIQNPPVIEVRSDGSMFYQPWYNDHARASAESGQPMHPKSGLVARLYLPRETERDTVAYWEGLKRFCSQSDSAPYCGLP